MKKIIVTILTTVVLLILWVRFRPSEYDRRMDEALLLKKQSKLTIFDGYEEPAMPDKNENNKTFLGVDKNKNSLRDDVEIWINRFAKNYNERMALRQAAINLEYELIAADQGDKNIISHAASVSYTDSECLRFIFGKDSLELIKILRTIVFNNKQRLDLLENFDKFSYSYESIVENSSIDSPYRACFFKIENVEMMKEAYLKSINR